MYSNPDDSVYGVRVFRYPCRSCGQDCRFFYEPSNLCLGTYPNPFNSSCIIDIDFGGNASISADIFDIRGRLICNIYSGKGYSGSVTWSPGNLESGVYLLRLSMDKRILDAKKLVYIG